MMNKFLIPAEAKEVACHANEHDLTSFIGTILFTDTVNIF